MTTLLLVRHGETEANRLGLWQGWEDTPLSELGLQQARAVAQRIAHEFAPRVVYSSSLRRALQTAAPIAEATGSPIIARPDLREIHFGQISGLTYDQFREEHPELYKAWTDKDDLDFGFPDGETRKGFFARVRAASAEILAAHEEGEIVVVSHGGSLRTMLAHLLGGSFGEWWNYGLGNASLTVVDVRHSAAELLLLDDRSHLDGMAT